MWNRSSGPPGAATRVALALNKLDRVRRPALLPLLAELSARRDWAETFLISAETGDGVADLKRAGGDVSIVTHGKMVHVALQAAGKLAKEGVEADVLDLRSLRPLDVDAILASVRKTNRVVYLEEGWPYVGIGAQIISVIQEEAFDDLDAPVLRVSQADVPMPYAKNLERLAKPSVERVVAACNRVLYRNGASRTQG